MQGVITAPNRKERLYAGVQNEWVQGLCDKRRYKCADCPNRAFVSLNYEAVKAHLRGMTRCVGTWPPFIPCARTIPHGCWRRI